MRYFVTGATGFLGRELVRRLLSQGHEIRALVRDRVRASELDEAILFEGDVTEKESMREGMQGVDGLFHVAGWYKIGTRDKRPGELVNVQGTRNVLELMRELEVPKGVYVSSLAVHSNTHGRIIDESYRFTGRHLSEYDRTKAAAHDLAMEMISQGLPLVIGMPGVIYGPGDQSSFGNSLQAYLRRDLPMVPRGSGACFTYVKDVAQGLILCMEKGRKGESYHLCGEPAYFVDVFNLAEEITAIPAPPSVPVW
ncbi:MAG TPA: NAD-dependent epimerase/dehydratase family protein, partial [Anaerolineales bacterium]